MIRNIIHQKATRLFIILAAVFIANALIAELIGVKIFSLETSLGWQPVGWKILGQEFSFNLTAGVLLWPVVFILTDIINEYYGPRGVRFLSFMAAGVIAYSFFVFWLAIGLTPAAFWARNYFTGVSDSNTAFAAVLGQGQSIIIGSLAAFVLGQLLDVAVFHRIKKMTGERAIWLRATGSTLVSQFVDSFVVLFIAFYVAPRITGASQPWPFAQVMAICIGNYIYKFVVALLLTPVIYGVHAWVEKYLGHHTATDLKRAAMQNE